MMVDPNPMSTALIDLLLKPEFPKTLDLACLERLPLADTRFVSCFLATSIRVMFDSAPVALPREMTHSQPELARGLEPLTFGLQIRCSTS